MALLAKVQTEYAYALQDLGALLEQINVTPTTDVRDRAILAGVNYFTRRVPRVKAILVSSIAAGFYPVPADWIDISKVVALEFPINNTPPIYYSPKAVRMHPRENETLYYYPDPNPGGQFRLIYHAAHGATVSLPSETIVGSIPDSMEGIVGMMAASVALREYASRCANMVQNNLDSVNYRSKSKEFTEAADAMDKEVDRLLRRSEIENLKRGDPKSYFKGWQI